MSDPSSLATELRGRIEAVLASLPGWHGPALQPPEVEPLPTWLVLPMQLDAAWSIQRTETARRQLTELLWGQYALFLFIRLQDDLLDGQQQDHRLAFVADRFLLESLGRIAGELGDFYRARFRETVDAILEVRRLEARPGQFTHDHLGLHTKVSGIFKIAATGVCLSCDRRAETCWISHLMDELAIFSQICDDVCDLIPDLEAGRFTWVANTLLAAELGDTVGVAERPQRLSDGLLRGERRAVIVDELRAAAQRAAEIVPAGAPASVHDLARALRGRAEELDTLWHESTVRSVFAALL